MKGYSLSGVEVEAAAAAELERLLAGIPFVERVEVEQAQAGMVDLVATVQLGDRMHRIVVEVKRRGQPREVREGIYHLKRAKDLSPETSLLFVAPYLSEEARRVCVEADVGYMDLEGNFRLVFDRVFIERTVPTKPPAARRELKSLFKPKSAQVLRALLRDPGRRWRVVDLAETSGVSLGHVSNVRTALLGREWAEADADGLRLSEPDALLDSWRDNYEPPPGLRLPLYTPLHGEQLDQSLRRVLGGEGGGRAMLAAHSAAEWHAPFLRHKTIYLYLDESGLAATKELLQTSRPAGGGNLIVMRLKDDGLFRDSVEPADGIVTTSAVQTYLDLWQLGERGQEAAEHLRREQLQWSK